MQGRILKIVRASNSNTWLSKGQVVEILEQISNNRTIIVYDGRNLIIPSDKLEVVENEQNTCN